MTGWLKKINKVSKYNYTVVANSQTTHVVIFVASISSPPAKLTVQMQMADWSPGNYKEAPQRQVMAENINPSILERKNIKTCVH